MSATSTPDERDITFKRLFLGAEGIFDLETVPLEGREAAEAERHAFLQSLAHRLLPDSMPNVVLFRDLFTTIVQSSDAAHSSRMVSQLLNRFIG